MSPNCLQLKTWLQLVWPHQMRHHQSSLNKYKSAWQLSRNFVEGWRTNTSLLSKKRSPNCLPGCNLKKLIQTKHDQSSINKIQKCLTAVRVFCGGMRNEHLSSIEKKVTELLAAEDLAATCVTSFKQNMISHHSIKFKSAWQLSGFLLRDEERTSLIYREKSHRIACSWRPGCNLYNLIRHHESSLNRIQKCLTAVGIFCWGMKNEHLSSVEKKVTELLAAKDLAATCITSSKWDIISHHSINVKVLDSYWETGCNLYDLIQMRHHQSSLNKLKSVWQLSGNFVEGWRTNTSLLSRKKSPNCLQLKTWL